MATDWDPLDDILPEQTANNARARAKFQPRARKGPKKQTSAPIPFTQPSRPHNPSGDGSPNLVDQSLSSSELLDTEKQVEHTRDISSTIHPPDDSLLAKSDITHFEVGETPADNDAIPIVGGDLHFVTRNSSEEVTDIFVGLESLHDVYPESTISAVGTANTSPEKVPLVSQLANESTTSLSLNNDVESSFPPPGIASAGLSDNQGAVGHNSSPEVTPPDNFVSILEPSSVNTHRDVSNTGDPLISGEAVISNSDRGLETERAEANFSVESLDNSYDLTSMAGQRSGKFQPKPKIRTDREKPTPIISEPNETESNQYFQDDESLCFDLEVMNEGSIPVDTALNSQTLMASDSTSEFLANEEVANLVDDSLADVFVPENQQESFPETLGEVSESGICGNRSPIMSNDSLEQQNAFPMESNDSLKHQTAFVSGEEAGAGRSLQPRRKQKSSYNLIDESDGEANEDRDTYECPTGPLPNEAVNDDNECPAADVTLKRKARRKSNKDAAPKEKPVRKRKKTNAAEDQPSKEPPKKRFPHSTRRKRRQVDKALLDTPEEDIDMSKLPIRDIILLAEHRERMMSKEKALEAPSINQSAAASSFFEHDEEDDMFASEQGDDFSYERPNPVVQESSHTNYHSFMKKTPRSRWTKQDTELFYEGVEQFGSDISMIQQLFPGRTRAQVKLKYKKEERQNPMRLHDALTGRRPDHSHFQVVIERLKELAAQEKQSSFREDSIGLPDGDEEMDDRENNDKVGGDPPEKAVEEAGEEVVEAAEPDDVQSPVKNNDDDDEDEMSRWDQYTEFD